LDPSIEKKTSTTVGSIRSKSDYLFQLRDFELVFEELCVSLVTADQPPGDNKAAEFHSHLKKFRSNFCLAGYGVAARSLPIDWVRKQPVEKDHSQGIYGTKLISLQDLNYLFVFFFAWTQQFMNPCSCFEVFRY
jgi:hypothetical protein